jgi:eIF3 subunit 6 N terminal domain.
MFVSYVAWIIITGIVCIGIFIMAKFDLTSRMGQYLDRHLIFPLLEFLSAKQVSEFENIFTNVICRK